MFKQGICGQIEIPKYSIQLPESSKYLYLRCNIY